MTLRSGLLCSVAVLIALSGEAKPSAAQTNIKSNLDIVSQLASEIAEEIMTHFPIGAVEKGVVLAPYEKDETYRFLNNILTQVISSKGHKVYSLPGVQANSLGDSLEINSAVNALRIEFQVLQFGIQYPKIYRSHLVGGKRVLRRADLRVFVKILDPADDSVVWVGESGRKYNDKFPFRLISQVEAGLFKFAKPARQGTKWGRIIEPVVVSGIIVGLIYLFYSNQSSD